jgi:hypothetical protein
MCQCVKWFFCGNNSKTPMVTLLAQIRFYPSGCPPGPIVSAICCTKFGQIALFPAKTLSLEGVGNISLTNFPAKVCISVSVKRNLDRRKTRKTRE